MHMCTMDFNKIWPWVANIIWSDEDLLPQILGQLLHQGLTVEFFPKLFQQKCEGSHCNRNNHYLGGHFTPLLEFWVALGSGFGVLKMLISQDVPFIVCLHLVNYHAYHHCRKRRYVVPTPPLHSLSLVGSTNSQGCTQIHYNVMQESSGYVLIKL